jgi:hypothetical protein
MRDEASKKEWGLDLINDYHDGILVGSRAPL